MELENALKNAATRLESEELESFEVFGLEEDSLVIESKRQMVELFKRQRTRGIAIRVTNDERMGWSATTDVSQKAVAKAVKQAVSSLALAGKSKEAYIVSPSEPAGDFAEKVGRSFSEIPDDEKVRRALAIESAAIAFDSRISRVRNPRYQERSWQTAIVNSKGVSTSAHRSLASCQLSAIAVDGASSESAYEYAYSPRFEDLNIEEVARGAARRAVAKLGAKGIETASLPVIFTNRAAASMVGLVAPSFFADNVQRGKSVLAGRIGDRVYSPLVGIWDDGLMPGGVGSFPFDGEGVSQRRTNLVNEGVISAWLYDGPRALCDGALSTGNCRRSHVGKLPSIGVTNCFLAAGTKEPRELTSSISRGVVVTDLIGLHTANPVSGDFSLGAEGFFVEDGRESFPVRGVIVAGNIHEFFKRVEGVAADLKMYGSFGAPMILVEGLKLGG